MNYIKPELKTYTAKTILEAMGPCQNQYTTTTFYTTSGNSTVNVDGYITWLPTPQTYEVITNAEIQAGDVGWPLGDDPYRRGFVGFDITNLQGKTVVSATLRIFQVGTTGDPYNISTGLGQIVVDHVNFGNSLDGTAADFSNYIQNNIGTLSTNGNQEWKTLDVKTRVQADINAGRTSSQFRLAFTTNTDNDNITEIATSEDAEGSGGSPYKPELEVIYY